MKKITKLFTVLLAVLFLTSCTSKYKVDVNVTAEEREKVLAEMEDLKKQIDAFDTSKGTIAWAEIIDLALDYEKLGDLDKAISTYKSWLDKGFKTRALINNLGRLYEKVGETELAVQQYRRLIDEYQEDSYLYDITWAYINGKNRKEAEKYFNLWQLKFQKTDQQIQDAIKKLREEEQQPKQ